MEGHEELRKLSVSCVVPLSLKVAISLGVPDVLAKGPLPVDQIMSKLSSSSSSSSGSSSSSSGSSSGSSSSSETYEVRKAYLARLLRLLAAHNLFTYDASTRAYGLNQVSRWLVTDSPLCFAPFVLVHLDAVLLTPFEHLGDMILGRIPPGCAFEAAHGGVDAWAYCKEHPAWASLFNEGMASLSKRTIAILLDNYDGFAGLKSIVDVGGGTGLCMSFVAAAFPGIRALNFDLPNVVATAPALPGVQHVGGDMFESVPQGDAIFMRAVLHDWNDEQCGTILEKCYEALPSGGKLIVVEMVVDSCEASGSVMDVLMMSVTKGLERTRDEWTRLLEASPFGRPRFVEMPMPWSVIEATKQEP